MFLLVNCFFFPVLRSNSLLRTLTGLTNKSLLTNQSLLIFTYFGSSQLVLTGNTAWKKTCRGPEIPRYGPVFFENTGKSGSIMFHETRRVRRVSGTVFSPIRTFSESRKIRSPDTSLKRGVSRPGNCLIRPDLLRITTYRRLAQPIKLSIFTLILCYLWGFDRSSTVLQV